MKSKIVITAFSFAILSGIAFYSFVYICMYLFIYIKQASIILKVEEIFIAKMSVKKCIIWKALRSFASNLCTKICQASKHYESQSPKLQHVVLISDREHDEKTLHLQIVNLLDKNTFQMGVSAKCQCDGHHIIMSKTKDAG